MIYLVIASKHRPFRPNQHVLNNESGLIGIMTGQIDSVLNDKSLFAYVIVNKMDNFKEAIAHQKKNSKFDPNSSVAIFEIEEDANVLRRALEKMDTTLFQKQVKKVYYYSDNNQQKLENMSVPDEIVLNQYQEYFSNHWDNLRELNNLEKEKRAYTPIPYTQVLQQLEPPADHAKQYASNKKNQGGCFPWFKF